MPTQTLRRVLPWRFWVVAGSLLALSWVLESVGVLQPIEKIGVPFFTPVLGSVQQGANVFLWPIRFAQRTSNSSRKIQNLEQQLAEANTQLGELKTLRVENDFLRQTVASASVVPPPKIQRVSCRIVSYSPSVIEIPRGIVMRIGAPVISNGALVGKIESISGNQAVVKTLSQSAGLTVIGQLRETQVSGILQGENGKLFLTELPPENQPVVGDHVVTATQPDVPMGVNIGLISAVQPEQGGSGVRAEVTPAASFFQAAFVEVWQ